MLARLRNVCARNNGSIRVRLVRPAARRGVLCGIVLATGLFVASTPAHANAPNGPAWPRGVITFHVAAPSLRWGTVRALAEWNRSGARLRFVETTASKAAVSVVQMPRRACQGINGVALVVVRSGRFRGKVSLQPNCSREYMVSVAAHEFGHILGLGHEFRRCAVMSPSVRVLCGDALLPWEWVCHPLAADDVLGAIRLYGGHPRRSVAPTVCLSAPTPGPATAVRLEANPADSLAATRVTWRNPASAALRRVVVNRRRGQICPTYPTLTRTSFRPGVPVLPGELVGDVDASRARGTEQSVLENAPPAPGLWCYAVWTLGPANRWRRAAQARIVHPGLAQIGSRIGLHAVLAPAPGVRVRVAWTTPRDPTLGAVELRRLAAECPAETAIDAGDTIAAASTMPGATSVDDTDTSLSGGTWCYTLLMTPAGTEAQPISAQLEVAGVPAPPNSPPQPAFASTPQTSSVEGQ
jgi:hypothetical protein